MNKPFFVFSIWDGADGVRHKAASDYETLDETKRAFHAMLATHIGDNGTDYVIVTAVNEYGITVIPPEFWGRSKAEQDTETEE